MLSELVVRDLGVIAESHLLLGDGMTALTGETGAGKTMLVDAIELLVGGRADPTAVRSGAKEARVDGRFVVPSGTGPTVASAAGAADDDRDDGSREVVLSRVVPRSGRSRAYIDGRPATASELAEWGRALVDLHGQHAHQSLLSVAAQRDVLDRFGRVDLAPWRAARLAVAEIDARLAELGGDPRARARELDLLRFQVEELSAAALTDPDEDEQLATEEDALADADAHQDAAEQAAAAVSGDGGAADSVGQAVAAVAGRGPFSDVEPRLRAVAAELADLAAELRDTGERIERDPARLEEIRLRRQLLRDLRRKYGDTLSDVIGYAADADARLAELASHDETVTRLDADRAAALDEQGRHAAAVGSARRAAAPLLAAEIAERLADLAMPGARVEVGVGDEDPGAEVEIRLAANVGAEPLSLAKAASGGELARTMLGIRLVLTSGPPVLVFDEVDAGIGGEAAVAVGRALSAVAADHQVLVVTHLPQVAAAADHQVAITKRELGGTTVSEARLLDPEERILELSRMLSGDARSTAAREHAAELLQTAGRSRS